MPRETNINMSKIIEKFLWYTMFVTNAINDDSWLSDNNTLAQRMNDRTSDIIAKAFEWGSSKEDYIFWDEIDEEVRELQ